MSKKTRRRFTAEQRATILRRHLADKVPISDLCDEYGIQPSLLYSWQKQLFENMESALQDARQGNGGAVNRKVDALEQKLAAKDEVIARKEGVIAEVAEAYVTLKKTLGQS